MVPYNELSEMLLCAKLNKINGNSTAHGHWTLLF
jgi:hypothetical protein